TPPKESVGAAPIVVQVTSFTPQPTGRSDEPKNNFGSRIVPEPDIAMLKPVAVPVGSAPSAVTTIEPGVGVASGHDSRDAEHGIPLLTPVDDPSEREPEILVPLIVDLGPEPPLSQGIARSKSAFSGVFSLGPGSVFEPGGSGSDTSTTTS